MDFSKLEMVENICEYTDYYLYIQKNIVVLLSNGEIKTGKLLDVADELLILENGELIAYKDIKNLFFYDKVIDYGKKRKMGKTEGNIFFEKDEQIVKDILPYIYYGEYTCYVAGHLYTREGDTCTLARNLVLVKKELNVNMDFLKGKRVQLFLTDGTGLYCRVVEKKEDCLAVIAGGKIESIPLETIAEMKKAVDFQDSVCIKLKNGNTLCGKVERFSESQGVIKLETEEEISFCDVDTLEYYAHNAVELSRVTNDEGIIKGNNGAIYHFSYGGFCNSSYDLIEVEYKEFLEKIEAGEETDLYFSVGMNANGWVAKEIRTSQEKKDYDIAKVDRIGVLVHYSTGSAHIGNMYEEGGRENKGQVVFFPKTTPYDFEYSYEFVYVVRYRFFGHTKDATGKVYDSVDQRKGVKLVEKYPRGVYKKIEIVDGEIVKTPFEEKDRTTGYIDSLTGYSGRIIGDDGKNYEFAKVAVSNLQPLLFAKNKYKVSFFPDRYNAEKNLLRARAIEITEVEPLVVEATAKVNEAFGNHVAETKSEKLVDRSVPIKVYKAAKEEFGFDTEIAIQKVSLMLNHMGYGTKQVGKHVPFLKGMPFVKLTQNEKNYTVRFLKDENYEKYVMQEDDAHQPTELERKTDIIISVPEKPQESLDLVLEPGEEMYSFGLIYLAFPTYVYIHQCYANGKYIKGKKVRDSVQFVPGNAQIDFEMDTLKYCYLVKFVSGGKAPNPRKPEELVEVIDYQYPVKLVKEFQKELYTRIRIENEKLVLNAVDKEKISARKNQDFEIPERQSGQTIESYLNIIVDKSLQQGAVEAGLKKVEEYRRTVNDEVYNKVRLRLLLRYCKEITSDDTKAGNVRIQTIQCIDENLKYTGDPKKRLSLLLEKGIKQLKGDEEEKKNSRETFTNWLQLYNEYIANHPEAVDGLMNSYDQAIRALEGEEGSLLDSAENEEMSQGLLGITNDTMVQFVRDILDKQNYSVLGEGMEKYDSIQDVKQTEVKTFLEEEWKTVDETVGEGSKRQLAQKRKRFWAMAKIYAKLEEEKSTLLDMEKLLERGRIYLKEAALLEAEKYLSGAMVREKNGDDSVWGRNACQFCCALALEIEPDERILTAMLRTIRCSMEEFRNAIKGDLSLNKFLTLIKNNKKTTGDSESEFGIVLRKVAVLCYHNSEVKKLFLAACDDDIELQGALVKQLKDVLGSDESNGVDDVSDLLDLAIQDYQNFIVIFNQLNVEKSISEIASMHLDFFNNPYNTRWVTNEVIQIKDFVDMYSKLGSYFEKMEFAKKVEILQDGLEDLNRKITNIHGYPSLNATYLYLPRMENLYNKLLSTYKTLYASTKPNITIEQCAEVERKDKKVILTVPIRFNKKDAQEEKNLKLVVEQNENYSLTRNEIMIDSTLRRDSMYSTAWVELELYSPDVETINLGLRLEYEYVSDIEIRECDIETNKHFYKKHTEYCEQETKVFYPGPTDSVYEKQQVYICEELVRKPIPRNRIKKFNPNGNIPGLKDDKQIRNILRNREADISKAIDNLACERKNASGENVFVPKQDGNWVVVYGQWRVGKTVILNYINVRLQELFPDSIILQLTMTGGSSDGFAEKFANKILHELYHVTKRNKEYQKAFAAVCKNNNLKYDQFSNVKVSWNIFESFMKDFIVEIRKKNSDIAVFLLVDEFTEMYQAIINKKVGEDFPGIWLDAITNTNLLCVTAGGEHTLTMMTTYAPNTMQKLTADIEVLYLIRDNVDEYVHYIMGEGEEEEEPVKPAQSYFGISSQEAIERIYILTRGNAYLLMIFCTELINYMIDEKCHYLTPYVVQKTLDSIAAKNWRDDKLEATYFNSLYNPFNETVKNVAEEKETQSQGGKEELAENAEVKHIEDDKVKRDNQEIMHAIVEITAKAHKCSKKILRDTVTMNNSMTEEIFEKRYETLISRGIIVEDMDKNKNKNVFIYIDLYYELVKRVKFNKK